MVVYLLSIIGIIGLGAIFSALKIILSQLMFIERRILSFEKEIKHVLDKILEEKNILQKNTNNNDN